MSRSIGISASIALLALSACDREQEPATKGVAQGKILERSISDDMLPYDTVRSQPPRLEPEPEPGTSSDGDAPTRGADSGAQPAGDEDNSGDAPQAETSEAPTREAEPLTE